MAKKSIAKNYLYNLTYQILTLILPLITTPYVSRVLGAEGIGIYSYTYSIVSYFILFGGLGIALYGKREIAYVQEKKEERKRIFYELVFFRAITLVIGIAIYSIFFVNSEPYGVYYKIWLIELIATMFDISWFFQGLEEFKRTVVRNIMVRLASVTLIFVLVKEPSDLSKYFMIYSVADLIGNLSLWLYLPKYFKGIKINHINIFKHSYAIVMLFIPQIASTIYNMLDKTMIGTILVDKTEVGYYEQGQKVIRILLTIVTSLGIVMIPRMASTFASGDTKKLNEYMRRSFNFTFFLAFPMIFGLISVASEFVPIFFGKGYEKVVILMSVISPILLLMGTTNVIGTQYLLPTKKQKEYALSILAGVAVNFVLNIILIKLWNSIGASIATVASELVVLIVQLYMVRNELNIKDIFKGARNYLLSSLIMFAVCMLIKHFINVGIISIVVQVAIGGAVYIGMLLILKDENVFMFIDKIKEKINGILNRN